MVILWSSSFSKAEHQDLIQLKTFRNANGEKLSKVVHYSLFISCSLFIIHCSLINDPRGSLTKMGGELR
ncbi:hypothetical protein DP130_05490 [Clostridium tetani]|uniref:Uncharacterized protein n=1 Tax=Clostridium tetani TaxID=1513 RepID=A0A4Q0VE35_CLOTA|nr:hypothetical protein DP130_05490 [Clostridium tetani]